MATLNGASYSFYMISAARVQFIALGSPASSVTSGVATLQTSASFAATSLGGNSLLITNGNSTAGPISTAASFFSQANPNQITAGVLNQNNSGNVSSENFTGTYTVAANGRGTATLSTGQTYVFYLIGVNQGVIQETDNSIVSDGTLAGLAGGPFSTSSLAGGYAVQLTGVAAGIGEQDVVGQINCLTERASGDRNGGHRHGERRGRSDRVYAHAGSCDSGRQHLHDFKRPGSTQRYRRRNESTFKPTSCRRARSSCCART